jgi:hypothetical protein
MTPVGAALDRAAIVDRGKEFSWIAQSFIPLPLLQLFTTPSFPLIPYGMLALDVRVFNLRGVFQEDICHVNL